MNKLKNYLLILLLVLGCSSVEEKRKILGNEWQKLNEANYLDGMDQAKLYTEKGLAEIYERNPKLGVFTNIWGDYYI